MKAYTINYVRCALVSETPIEYIVRNGEDVFSLLKTMKIDEAAEEYLYLLCLDNKGQVTGVHEISHGDINSSLASPREIFKRALLNNANAIILAHNHPSGDITPSKNDLEITERLKTCGELMQIPLIDHIIAGFGNNWTSLRTEGKI